jgi:hypothetical protein
MADRDLEAFRRDTRWPVHAVVPRIRLHAGKQHTRLDLDLLAQRIVSFNEFVLVAPPGMGKSTAMVQLANAVAAQRAAVPCLLPLPEWAIQTGVSLLGAVLRHAAFSQAREEELRLLASEGALVLFLDGWNELDTGARQRARQELATLRRDYPDLSVVLSTRHQAVPPPFDTALQLELESLDKRQQREIARAIAGNAGEDRLRQASHTDGLRELVRIPLFLTTLLDTDDAMGLALTKEALLASFVETQESRSRDRSEGLLQQALGFHREVLRALATSGIRTGTTSLRDSDARPIVRQVYDALAVEGQIASSPHPGDVLDVLVAEHLLIRTGDGALMFQHHQFQEWFASFHVELLLEQSAAGNAETLQQLKVDVLDNRVWEEPLFFACQRLSGRGDGLPAIANAIRLVLEIDPMLAADIIHVCPAVWPQVREDVMSFAARWHTPGTVDRAIGFMLSTGCQDFLPTLSPLFRSEERHARHDALRAGRRFNASLFGNDPVSHLLGYPESNLGDVLLELIHRGSAAGARLAAEVASRTPNVELQALIAENLFHRGMDSDLGTLLENADAEVWEAVARHFDPEDDLPRELASRLLEERRRYVEAQTDPARRLGLLLSPNATRPVDFEAQLEALLADPALSIDSDHVHHLLHVAAEMSLHAVGRAMITRAEAGMSLPFRAADFVRDAGIHHQSPTLLHILQTSSSNDRQVQVAAAAADAGIVGWLVEALLVAHGQSRDADGRRVDSAADEYFRVKALIHGSSLASIVDAISARTPTDTDPTTIGILAKLLTGSDGERIEVPDPNRERICEHLLQSWGQVVTATGGNRHTAADMAGAIGSIGSKALVPTLLQLLEYDLRGWQQAIEEGNRPVAQWSFTLQYHRALSALADSDLVRTMLPYLAHPQFGFEAALVIHDATQARPEDSHHAGGWIDSSFLGMMARSGGGMPFDRDAPVSTHVDAIFAACDEMAAQGNHDLAARLASVAVRMPCGNPTDRVHALLRSPAANAHKLMLARSFVLAGGILSSTAITTAIDAIRQAGESRPWLLDPEHSPLNDWICLLPFSDRPEQTHAAWVSIPPDHRVPHRQHGLLRAIAIAGGEPGETVLFAMADADLRYLEEYEWWRALRSLYRVSATDRALILLSTIRSPRNAYGNFSDQIRDTIVDAITSNTDFRRHIYRLLDAQPTLANLLARAIAESPDIEGIVQLVRHQARNPGHHNGVLFQALRSIAVMQRPSEQFAGAYDVFSVPVPGLRRRLFAMSLGDNDREANIATRALEALDELRDEHGAPEQEPRHPDINTGIAWPRLAQNSDTVLASHAP